MALLDELYRKKSKYESLKKDVKRVLSSLNDSISLLHGPSSSIKNYYIINGQSADKNIIYNSKNSLLSKRDYIVKNVLPAINDDISDIEEEIEEELERIREEEEEEEEEEREREEERKRLGLS